MTFPTILMRAQASWLGLWDAIWWEWVERKVTPPTKQYELEVPEEAAIRKGQIKQSLLLPPEAA
jgi:hypothetical protein